MTDILPPENFALTPSADTTGPVPVAALKIEPEEAPSVVVVASRTVLPEGSVLEHFA